MNEKKKREKKREALLQKNRSTKKSSDHQPIYESYTHPHEFFTVDRPLHWHVTLDKKDQGITMRSPTPDRIEFQFLILPVSFDTSLFEKSGTYEEAMKSLQLKMESINLQSDPNLFYPCIRGELPDQPGYRWTFAAEDLVMGISAVYSGEHAHLYQPMIERIISSFRVLRKFEGLRARTMMKVVELLSKQAPEIEAKVSATHIKCGDLLLNADNLTLSIQRNPFSEAILIEEYVTSVIATHRARKMLGKESWDDVHDRVLPMIRSDSILRQIQEQIQETNAEKASTAIAQSEMVYSSWLANLIICYAIDDDRTLRMICQADCDRWGIDSGTLHQTAIDNLSAAPLPSMMCPTLGDEDFTLGVLNGGKGATSSFILHPELYRFLQDKIDGGFWVALPNRDSIMVFAKAKITRDVIQKGLNDDFASSNHPISDRLFCLTADGVVLD